MSSSVLERSCLRSNSVQRLGINRLWQLFRMLKGIRLQENVFIDNPQQIVPNEEQLGPKMSSSSSESKHLLEYPGLLQL